MIHGRFMLLVSNWDTKKSNLAIFEDGSADEPRYLYADVDWGASLGAWGNLFSWSKWDCKGFEKQSPKFVKGVENGELSWGFKGKNRKDMTTNISQHDVRWILQYLGRITDEQIRTGLAASGASPQQTECYTRALRQRIGQLQQAAKAAAPQTTN